MNITLTVIIVSLIGLGAFYLLSAIEEHDDILKIEKEEK